MDGFVHSYKNTARATWDCWVSPIESRNQNALDCIIRWEAKGDMTQVLHFFNNTNNHKSIMGAGISSPFEGETQDKVWKGFCVRVCACMYVCMYVLFTPTFFFVDARDLDSNFEDFW